MFDFGFAELLFISVLGLIILGPSRLAVVIRMLGLWLGRLRRTYNNVKLEIEREVGMDDIRRQLHNEQVMSELKEIEKEASDLKREVNTIASKPSSLASETTHSPPEPPAEESAAREG